MNQVKAITANPHEIIFSPTNPRRRGGIDFTQRPDWPEFCDSVRQHGVMQRPLVRPIAKGRFFVDTGKFSNGNGFAVLDRQRVTPQKTYTGEFQSFKTEKEAEAALPKYEIVAGDRRVTAAQFAKLPEINLDLAELNDAQVIELQQIENLQREDLSPLEEAQGYADWRDSLLASKTCQTVEEAVAHICGKINRKRSAVFGKLAILKTSTAVQKALSDGKIDASKAGLLATIPNQALQDECLKKNQENGGYGCWETVRELQQVIEKHYRVNLKEATFDLKETWMWTDQFPIEVKNPAPSTAATRTYSCAECPMNLKNICTNPICFQAKTQAKTDAILNQAKADGKKVIPAKEYERKRHELENEDDTCWQDKKNRHYGVLAKMAKVEPMVAVNRRGEAIKVFSKEQVGKIRATLKIKDSPSGGSDDYSRKKAKAKKENTPVAHAAVAAVLRAMEAGALDGPLWGLLAEAAYHLTNIHGCDFVTKRRGLARTQAESRPALQKLLKAKLTSSEYMKLAFELLLCAGALDWNGGIDDDFKKLCELAGVNLGEIKTQVKEWDTCHTGYGAQIGAATALTPEIQKIIATIDEERVLDDALRYPGGLHPDVWSAVDKRKKALKVVSKKIKAWADGKTDKHPLEDELNPEVPTKATKKTKGISAAAKAKIAAAARARWSKAKAKKK